MAVYRDEVAVIKSRDLGESDKLVTLFGRKRGRFTVVAKGIRLAKSRKRGHLETFNLCRVSCAEGKNIDILVEAEEFFSLDSDQMSTEEFERVGLAGMVVDRFLAEGISYRRIFDLWKAYIQSEHSAETTGCFVVDVIYDLGFISPQKKSDIETMLEKGSDLSRLRKYVEKILNNI
ncbi:DNA repair protein RecO [Candidatus Dojkabacteria bacterium]|nr:DNA repair protein RecO [Candidatus Dojkabacteria bacterium]